MSDANASPEHETTPVEPTEILPAVEEIEKELRELWLDFGNLDSAKESLDSSFII